MYEAFYQLSADPFRLSPDPGFCFQHRTYRKAMTYMLHALHRAEGFIMITGQPGTGKTTLVNDLIRTLKSDRVSVAKIVSTQLTADDLLNLVAYSFNINPEGGGKARVLMQVKGFLEQQYKHKQRPLLIVDEAQDMGDDALEELRLLTNMMIDNQQLLQVFLVGQEQLRALVHTPALEQLSQRLIAATQLEPLDTEDTEAYIKHRLRRVNWTGDPLLSKESYAMIQRFSRGIPRRINQICSRFLLHGSIEEKHRLGLADLKIVVEELQQELLLPMDVVDGEEAVAWPAEPYRENYREEPQPDPAPAEQTKSPEADRISTTHKATNNPADANRNRSSDADSVSRAAPEAPPSTPVTPPEVGLDEQKPPPRAAEPISPPAPEAVPSAPSPPESERGEEGPPSSRLDTTSPPPPRAAGTRSRIPAGQPMPTARARRGTGGNYASFQRTKPRLSGRYAAMNKTAVWGAAASLLVLITVLAVANFPADDGDQPVAEQETLALNQPATQPVTSPARQDSDAFVDQTQEEMPAPEQPVETDGQLSATADSATARRDSKQFAALEDYATAGSQPASEPPTVKPDKATRADAPVEASVEQSQPSQDVATPTQNTAPVVKPALDGQTEHDDNAEQGQPSQDEPAVLQDDAAATPAPAASQAAVDGSAEQSVANEVKPKPAPETVALVSERSQTKQASEPLPVKQADAETPAKSEAEKIADYLDHGRRTMKRNQLLFPENNSANYYFKRVLELDPGNADALHGIDQIIAIYARMATQALEKNDSFKAQRFIARGLRVKPGDEDLEALRERVYTQPSAE